MDLSCCSTNAIRHYVALWLAQGLCRLASEAVTRNTRFPRETLGGPLPSAIRIWQNRSLEL